MRHATTLALLSTCILTGCSSGKRISKANDALRLEREALKEQVTSLENENAELHVKIAELMQESDTGLTDEVLAAMPRVASIELTRYSSIWTEGGASEARFFVVPKDGRGRFVHAVGELYLAVMPVPDLDPDALAELIDAEPSSIGQAQFSITEVRDAYTSGMTGTAYMFQVPLDETPVGDLAFVVGFKDSITGVFHDTHRVVSP